ncbi:MAG: hypothetical protein RIS09_1222 [Actinomycetota bacterium]|jgi:hypothetical protein
MTSNEPELPALKEDSRISRLFAPFLNWGTGIFVFGFVFAFWPLAYGYIGSYLFCDGVGVESTCAPASAVWVLLITLPIGFVIMTVGGILGIFLALRKFDRRKHQEPAQQTVVPSSDGTELSAAASVVTPAFSKFSVISLALSPAIIYLVPIGINFGIFAPVEVQFALTFGGLVFAVIARIKKERFALVALATAIIFNLQNIFFAAMYSTLF